MENNLRHSLHVILNSAMKEKDEFINKICDMIESKDCNCQCSTIDLESGKKVSKERCNCTQTGQCYCGDDCNCKDGCNCHYHHHHHKHTSHAIINELAKISHSIDELNETIKQSRKHQ